MDQAEEIRMLRETITNLQWALVQTLSNLETMGQQMEINDDLAARITTTRQEIMQLQFSPPSEQVLLRQGDLMRKQGDLMRKLKNINLADSL